MFTAVATFFLDSSIRTEIFLNKASVLIVMMLFVPIILQST